MRVKADNDFAPINEKNVVVTECVVCKFKLIYRQYCTYAIKIADKMYMHTDCVDTLKHILFHYELLNKTFYNPYKHKPMLVFYDYQECARCGFTGNTWSVTKCQKCGHNKFSRSWSGLPDGRDASECRKK